MQGGCFDHLACRFVALCAFLDLDYVIGHQPVCLAVDCLRGLHVRRVEQAEDLAVLLVEPVLEDLRPVLDLGIKIPLVGPATASVVSPSMCLWWSMYCAIVPSLPFCAPYWSTLFQILKSPRSTLCNKNHLLGVASHQMRGYTSS